MIALKNEVLGKTLLLPTKYSEVSIDYLTDCIEHINLQDHHVIVALIYKEKMSTIIAASKSNNNNRSSIVYPVLAKVDNNGACEKLNYNIGDKLLISGTDLARAYHVSSSINKLSIDKVVSFIVSDKELLKKCSLGGKLSTKLITDDSYNYFVEFKVVPVNDIKAAYSNVTKTCKFEIDGVSDIDDSEGSEIGE